MATKRRKAKKKNPCWKGYTAIGDDGKIVMKKKGNKMVPACRPIKDGASFGGKRKALKELDKKSGQKVKTDRKGNVKKLTINKPNQTVTYKGGHVDATSQTKYSKVKTDDGKHTTATRTIDGTLHTYGNTGKKGKTIIKRGSGKKTIVKTNRKGETKIKERG